MINNHALGLFIISTHHQVLLQKREVPNYKVPHVWEPPLINHTPNKSALDVAQNHLEILGLDCKLYEAFTSTGTQQHHVQPFKGGCVVIALSKTSESPLLFATENYKWMALDELLNDIHKKPVNYATWLKKIIDSVALYLKKLLQEKHESTKHNSQWHTP